MDRTTIDYYNQDAEVLYHTYQSVQGGVRDFFPTAFSVQSRILDIGAGSGRDMIELLKNGHDVYGIDGSESLIELAKKNYPILVDRLIHRYFPETDNPFIDPFDGILCSALLMHIPKENLFDSVYTFKKLLKPGGKLLLSVPTKRDDVQENNRDKNGRLFLLYTIEYLQLIFERAGFKLLEHRINKDSLNRTGIEWAVLLFRLETENLLRPLDQGCIIIEMGCVSLIVPKNVFYQI
jgi:SAM-dependent methyltransferase